VDQILTQITETIIAGDPEQSAVLAEKALDLGLNPLACINQGLTPGMNRVGELYSSGEYFLPDLIAAGEAMKRALGILEPALVGDEQREVLGHIVIGTVEGDMHEIGKTLVATMLSANGFRVTDIGVDCNSQKFIDAVEETGATLIGASALLTTTMTKQRELIEALGEAGLRTRVKVLIGGAPVTSEWAEQIGADAYAEDALSAVVRAKQAALDSAG
jgi:corrinoid protein of di/trimethylamine methyltransferase